MISLVPLLLALWSPVALWWCAFALQLYLTVRLVFWQEVIVVEAAGVARSLRRSWQLVRGNWWRLAFLVVVTWGCGMLFRLLPAYLAVPVGSLPGSDKDVFFDPTSGQFAAKVPGGAADTPAAALYAAAEIVASGNDHFLSQLTPDAAVDHPDLHLIGVGL